MPLAAWSRTRIAGVLVLVAAVFAIELGDPPFVDEYAYITQSYQPDLLYAGDYNSPYWLESIAYDLVPLPKYCINLAFRAADIPRPRRRDAIAWYHNTAYRWGSVRELCVARLPSVVFAVLGCIALLALGATMIDRPIGWTAAVLLAVNPLYRLHAHRAMSEAYCEGLFLCSLFLGLLGWRCVLNGRAFLQGWGASLAAGLLAGLSTLAKFNGILALLCFAVWVVLAGMLPTVPRRLKLQAALSATCSIVVAWGVFVSLNPFMTAHPRGPLGTPLESLSKMNTCQRFHFLIQHRREVSRDQQRRFPHNALTNLRERAPVVAIQGFGRFGPFGPGHSDSTRRFDLAQDWGAFLWLPLVLTGTVITFRVGRTQLRDNRPPVAWTLLVWAGLALLVVTLYLPMAWDRYQLPIQAPSALLASIALYAGWERLWSFASRARRQVEPS
jgi:4-amino-4-deoxy-L-arabinose transferase-like glycosyltransferase